MPGIETGAPERTETREWVLRIAEAHTHLPLDLGQRRLDLPGEVVEVRLAVGVEEHADLGRDGEPGRDRQAEVAHLGEVGALTAQQRLHPGRAVRAPAARS